MSSTSGIFDMGMFLLYSLVPLAIVIWFIVTLTGIRRAVERIADGIDRMHPMSE